jgi:hypothetical protein
MISNSAMITALFFSPRTIRTSFDSRQRFQSLSDIVYVCFWMIKPQRAQRAQSLQKREMNNYDTNGFDMIKNLTLLLTVVSLLFLPSGLVGYPIANQP